MNATLSCKCNTQSILTPRDLNWVQHWVSRMILVYLIYFQWKRGLNWYIKVSELYWQTKCLNFLAKQVQFHCNLLSLFGFIKQHNDNLHSVFSSRNTLAGGRGGDWENGIIYSDKSRVLLKARPRPRGLRPTACHGPGARRPEGPAARGPRPAMARRLGGPVARWPGGPHSFVVQR